MIPPSVVLLAGRYRLGAPLGAGGMATVYDAVDERLERPVAVKVLRPDMAARADVRARFESEARSAARLTHPNVVAVFDSGEDEEVPFLVMERLPGETLGDRMQGQDVPTEWILRVAGDVLGALGAAHAAGIVHRDVKPGNILLADDGCAKVGDFGIAKSLEVAAAADLTNTNQLIGTPAYVAPERIIGEPASAASDLYALGVVLYEAFSGRKPFGGATPVATAYAIRHETPPPLRELRPDLPEHVIAAVDRAMAREAAHRFADAAEMAEALGVGVAGVPARFAAPADATLVAAPIAAASSTQVLSMPEVQATAAVAAAPALGDPDRRRLLLIALGGLLVAFTLLVVALAAGGDGDKGGREAPALTPTSAVPDTVAPTTTPPTTVTTAPPAPAPAGGSHDGKKKKGEKD